MCYQPKLRARILDQQLIYGTDMIEEYMYTQASETELNSLVEGKLAGVERHWAGRDNYFRLGPDEVGVLWKREGSNRPVKPLILVVRPESQQRLYGRFSQLRRDLSPLSTWCHILSPSQFEVLDGLVNMPNLGELEAAWVGLTIAEAAILTARPVHDLKLAVCLATQSYAFARSKALWPKLSTAEILDKYDNAQRLVKTSESSSKILRDALQPLWTSLILASSEQASYSVAGEHRMVVDAIRELRNARLHKVSDEAYKLRHAFEDLPEAEILTNLSQMTAERRVSEFDRVVRALEEFADKKGQSSRKSALAFLAAYIATVGAGGTPSLTLVEKTAQKWPELLAWAYIIGGIGEQVIWTSSFDGLGRLVARELMRPLRFDEPPTSDFALDEALILVDKQLSEPLVHMKIKQIRVISVSILPGVNVSLQLSQHSAIETRTTTYQTQSRQPVLDRDFLQNLADTLWPYLSSKMQSSNVARPDPKIVEYGSTKYKKERTKRSKSQPQLPLDKKD